MGSSRGPGTSGVMGDQSPSNSGAGYSTVGKMGSWSSMERSLVGACNGSRRVPLPNGGWTSSIRSGSGANWTREGSLISPTVMRWRRHGWEWWNQQPTVPYGGTRFGGRERRSYGRMDGSSFLCSPFRGSPIAGGYMVRFFSLEASRPPKGKWAYKSAVNLSTCIFSSSILTT